MGRRAFFTLLLLAFLLFPACQRIKSAKAPKYRDGLFEGETQSIYTAEPFYALAKLELKKQKIISVDFGITDKSCHEPFDLAYGDKHFAGIPLYLEQTKNDWAGMQAYPKKLLETQDLRKVEAIAGATWSYNMFKDSVTIALNKAKQSK